MQKVLGFLIPVLFLAACAKDKEVQCYHSVSTSPGAIGFVGFSSEELDTVHLKTYVQNGQYDSLISDSTVYLAVEPVADTARNTYGNTSVLGTRYTPYAYEVFIPATGRTYRIGGFYYDPLASYSYMANGCPKQDFTINGADSTVLDGMPTRMQPTEYARIGVVYLQR